MLIEWLQLTRNAAWVLMLSAAVSSSNAISDATANIACVMHVEIRQGLS